MMQNSVIPESKKILAAFTYQIDNNVYINFEYVIAWSVTFNPNDAIPLIKNRKEHELITINAVSDVYPNFSFKELLVEASGDKLTRLTVKYVDTFSKESNFILVFDGEEFPLP